MADRPDIDALLVSALYGELTPAEETRLAAHLESHPTDRTALSDLTRARELVRESRVLQLQFEPPQAVTSLILQEAARRAPKASAEEREGWFARFVRSFMAHPAMAAAAMLVVVVGVATFVSRRDGDQFARSTAPTATAPATTQAPPAADEGGAGKAAPEPAAMGSGVVAGDRDGDGWGEAKTATDQYKVDLVTKNEEEKSEAQEQRRKELAVPALEPPADKAPIAKATGTKGGIEVRSNNAPQPKYFEAAPKKDAYERGFADESANANKLAQREHDATGSSTVTRQDLGGGAGGRAPGAAPTTPPPAPPPPPPPSQSIAAGPRAGSSAASGAAVDDARLADPTAIAWAKEQHASVLAQVRAGNCTTAANLAVTLSVRDPAYYTHNVASDRELKSCLAYINNRVAQDVAQRAQRDRAKRAEGAKRAADQPAKPTSKPAATESTK